ncbi:hypothetical protein [Streptomyces sp. NPDC050759]|uniref:hypothetical protein n=1 Tax=Streptomyces sp. NPDC050759 TaxID=3365635 RepID=UPI0037A9CAD2
MYIWRDRPVRGWMLGGGPFADELGVPDGGRPQGQALGVAFPERVPLGICHAFAVPHVHPDAAGPDFLVPGGWVRRIYRFQWFRYDGRRVRHRPPEPEQRPHPSARTTPTVPTPEWSSGAWQPGDPVETTAPVMTPGQG